MSEFSATEVTFARTPYSESHQSYEQTVEIAREPAVDIDALHVCMRGASYLRSRTSDGVTQEIVVMNGDKADNGVMLQESTSFSGALKNPGNMVDLARRAADYRDIAHVYIASHGNYPSGRMPKVERDHLRATSRYTITAEDGTVYPLASFHRKAELLDNLGLAPTHFVADEEAGRLVMPWMLAVAPNSVKGVYIRGLNGISDHASNAQSFKDDMASRKERRSAEETQAGPGDLSPAGIKDVKDNMPQIYSGWLRRHTHLAPLFPKDVANKLMLMRAYGRHTDLGNLATHAVFQDTLAAIQRQNAPIVLAFNDGSNQHNRDAAIAFTGSVMDAIPEGLRTGDRHIRLLFNEGANTAHETDPRTADSVRRNGLRGTGGQLFRIAALRTLALAS